MKTHRILIFTLLVWLVESPSNTALAEPAGPFYFRDMDIKKVLEFYQAATGLELVVSSEVARIPGRITVESKVPISKDEAARMVARALREQARIVITPLDDSRASVTCNDALPIKIPMTTPTREQKASPPGAGLK